MNTENNILISEFIGYRHLPSDNINSDRYYNTAINSELFIEDAKYHSSWDWLIPVVEKIESLSSNQNVINWSRQNKTIFDFKLTESKIEAVYNAVIEFIKWYNESGQKE